MDPPPPGSSGSQQPPRRESTSSMTFHSARQQPPSTLERDDGLSESLRSTDTMRRHPGEGYGTIQSSTSVAPSPSIGGGEPSGAASLRSPLLGPAGSASRSKPRKPQMGRRTSSTAMTPHRGEVFSVDDDVGEVQADAVALASHIAHHLPTNFALDPAASPAAPKHPGTLRRRAAAAPSLPRVTSTPPGEEEQESPAATSATSATPVAPAAPVATPAPITPLGLVTPSASASATATTPATAVTSGAQPKPPTFVEEPTQVRDHVPADVREEDHADEEHEHLGDEEDDGDISDAESFTLKDRQQAINQTHPFGIRIWKAALYKKDRSVQKNAEADIHSSPGLGVSKWLVFFNLMWTIFFGWWMALFAAIGAAACFIFAAAPSARAYGKVLWGLAWYLFYPFGKFVRLETDEAYMEEDEGEGRSIGEYEQWQSGDLEYGRLFFGPDRGRSIVGRSRSSFESEEPGEADGLLGRTSRGDHSGSDSELPRRKRRLFGRGQWNIGRVIFFVVFYALLTPSLFIVSGICWLLVFWIPMGKVTILLFDHLRRHPLALSFQSDTVHAREGPQSSILVCTYRAVGLKYWKYTIDGTNIFLVNLMAVVFFVIFDWAVLEGALGIRTWFTSPVFLFLGGLFSVIPLAYFIGQAVASISAQSSMGLGAAVNAFFSTVVEVFLYCVALSQGKGQLVEGSIIGSIFAGILFLPGLSMCFGAIKRKTQRFNSKSAGVTSTMLLFAVVAAFGPTLFYQIYGTHEINCSDCGDSDDDGSGRDCRRCYFSQTPNLEDRFYQEAVRPYCYMAAGTLFLAYIIGLWFTLRTHAAVIWNTELDEKKHEEQQQQPARVLPPPALPLGESTNADIRDSHLYKRILGQSLRQVSFGTESGPQSPATNGLTTPHMVPPKSVSDIRASFPGLSEAENQSLVHGMAEIAATAAAIATRDVGKAPGRRASQQSQQAAALAGTPTPNPVRTISFAGGEGAQQAGATAPAAPSGPVDPAAATVGQEHGGHDAPNWSRLKSSIILLGSTVLYAIIAEILVDTVDVVLEGFAIDEKFLGMTLFALVPNTTEFLNAISFAMNGNIALSMEIGSAYALQVCLLQIPALVLYSAVTVVKEIEPGLDVGHYMFSLLFPQWDMVTVILCVFLLSYMYGEGKSNYFKGSILLLCYFVVILGFYFSGLTNPDGTIASMGSSRFDTMGKDGKYVTYKTAGRSMGGAMY